MKTAMPSLPEAADSRRKLIGGLAAGAAAIAFPRIARAASRLPAMTEGPFYPPPAFRARQLDWDADLTQVVKSPGQPAARAAGEWLDLFGSVVDKRGRRIDGAEVEIWQCDVFGSYRHPRGGGDKTDPAFQGFGQSVSDNQGRYRFRTIKPAPYPGRTPHIHVRVRHPSWGEVTSQLFVAGEPANARDFLYRGLSGEQRVAANMSLQPARPDAAVKWLVERDLVIAMS